MRDHIIIYLGNSDKHPVLAVLNGYNKSHHFVTNTSQVFIKFKSYADSFFNHGFSITYKETNEAPLNLPTCGGSVKQNSRIYLPNYATYTVILCEWRLQADVNQLANAHVFINNLPYGASSYGLYIYNGPNTSGTLLRHYQRGHINQNATYASDNEYLYIKFYVRGYSAETADYFTPYCSSYFDFFETD